MSSHLLSEVVSLVLTREKMRISPKRFSSCRVSLILCFYFAYAVYDTDVYPECCLDRHNQFCSTVARHSRYAELRVQYRGLWATVSIHRHGMGFLFEPQSIWWVSVKFTRILGSHFFNISGQNCFLFRRSVLLLHIFVWWITWHLCFGMLAVTQAPAPLLRGV